MPFPRDSAFTHNLISRGGIALTLGRVSARYRSLPTTQNRPLPAQRSAMTRTGQVSSLTMTSSDRPSVGPSSQLTGAAAPVTSANHLAPPLARRNEVSPFQRILIPLDEQTLAEAALRYAELIPSRSVSLLRVVAPGTKVTGEAGNVHWTDLDKAAQRFELQGRETERLVMTGDPVAVIIDVSLGCNLIVMASRGQGTFAESVAQRVAHSSPVPTLIVRAGAEPISGPPVGRIVVLVDGTASAERALEPAANLANELGVPVHLLCVRPAPEPQGERDARSSDQTFNPAEYLASWAHWFHSLDIIATAGVLEGDPFAEIVATLRPTDMIVLAPRPRDVHHQPANSLSDRLIENAPAPVMIVH